MVVIEVLIAIIVVSVLTLAFKTFFSKAKDELGIEDTKSLSALEDSLKKVLEKVNLGAATAAPVGMGEGVVSAESLAEVENLKKSVDDKQREIEELNGRITALKEMSSDSADIEKERARLEVKNKELEAKLSEYEIIAEDIADLAMYKDENSKLKKEIENLKANANAAPPAAAVSAPPPPAPVAAAPAPAAPSSDFGSALNGDLMAEFAKAVEDQLTTKTEPPPPPPPTKQPEPKPEPAQVAAEAPPVAEAAPPSPEPVAAPEPAAPSEPSAEEDDAQSMVDDLLKKMADEAKDLAQNDSIEAPDPMAASLDADKLQEEAATIEKVKQEDVQLMGQFENFVKKGAS